MTVNLNKITITGKIIAPPADPIGYFSVNGNYVSGGGIVSVNTFNRGSWNAGTAPGSSTSTPVTLPSDGVRSISTFYIPCTQSTYSTVYTQIYQQVLYSNYTSNATVYSPNPASPVYNGIGVGGYLMWTYSGTTKIANVGWVQL